MFRVTNTSPLPFGETLVLGHRTVVPPKGACVLSEDEARAHWRDLRAHMRAGSCAVELGGQPVTADEIGELFSAPAAPAPKKGRRK